MSTGGFFIMWIFLDSASWDMHLLSIWILYLRLIHHLVITCVIAWYRCARCVGVLRIWVGDLGDGGGLGGKKGCLQVN